MNNNYRSFDDMRVGYNAKSDTIVITTGDTSLAPHGFRVTLRPGSHEDLVLRQLLTESGHITNDSTLPDAQAYDPDEDGTDPWNIPLGKDSDNHTVWWDWSHAPHGLIVGKPGSGKTTLNTSIHDYAHASGAWNNIYSLSRDNGDDATDILTMIESQLPDYYGTLIILDGYAISDLDYATRQAMHIILKLGRAYRVHLVWGCESSSALPASLRDNLTQRIALGNISHEDSKHILGTTLPARRSMGRLTAYVLDHARKLQRIRLFRRADNS